jgi:hypothetical protein
MVAPGLGNYNFIDKSGLTRLTAFRQTRTDMRQATCDNACRERQCLPNRRFTVAKYRQHGYQDSGEKREKQSSSERGDRPAKKDTFGPRPLQMPGTHAVSRCAQCGTLLPPGAESIAQCPKCAAALHSCRQCTYFDTSSRFECSQPIAERIPRKDERNDCTFFSMRVRVEKETSTPKAARPMDARQAFENLFKK